MKKNALITGSSGNLGAAVVERFVADGYGVVATVTPGKDLGFTPSGDVTTYEADLTNEAQVTQTIARILQEHRQVHAAMLLVGGFSTGKIADTSGEALQKMYSLNFETAYFVLRPLLAHMLEKNFGRIVLVGSRPALKANEGKHVVAYALSKGLLFQLAEIVNAEGAAHNVTASVIVPGTIDTPSTRKSMPDADFSKWVNPDEIAALMAMIVGEEGRSLREPVFKIYGG